MTYSELIFINGRILKDTAIQAGTQKIRDIDLLLAAEQRPQASAFGADAYPTLNEKAAALLHSLARNHPFKDGNKRTAVVCLLFMLEVNGQRALWKPEDALLQILDIAEGRASVEDFAIRLHTEPVKESPEPDTERDTAHIDALLHAHRWLLTELAKQ